MPELPEVEFARGCLKRWLGGRTLEKVEADRTRITRGADARAFAALAGHRLQDVERRGKWLLWVFDGGSGVLAHLGMTGKFVRRRPGDPEVHHSRVRFYAADGTEVHYQDPRMFGRMAADRIDGLRADPGFRALGPDAWDSPPSAATLRKVFASGKRAVKDVLMDQTILAGIGNIQATEALFRARVHPSRKAGAITPAECRRLAAAIHWTLARSLRMNGGDSITYVEEPGEHDNPFRIYGRAGETCPVCRTKLRAIAIAGRTSTYCPSCQPRRALPVG